MAAGAVLGSAGGVCRAALQHSPRQGFWLTQAEALPGLPRGMLQSQAYLLPQGVSCPSSLRAWTNVSERRKSGGRILELLLFGMSVIGIAAEVHGKGVLLPSLLEGSMYGASKTPAVSPHLGRLSLKRD